MLVSALCFIKYFCSWVDPSIWLWAREKLCVSCKDAFVIPPLPLQYSSVPRNGDQVESLTELASSLMFLMRPGVCAAGWQGRFAVHQQNVLGRWFSKVCDWNNTGYNSRQAPLAQSWKEPVLCTGISTRLHALETQNKMKAQSEVSWKQLLDTKRRWERAMRIYYYDKELVRLDCLACE